MEKKSFVLPEEITLNFLTSRTMYIFSPAHQLAGGLRSWKPTPNVFSFAEKADLAGRSPVCTGPSNPPIASSGRTHLGPSCETAQNALLGAALCKGKLCSGNKPQPQGGLAQDRSACLVLT